LAGNALSVPGPSPAIGCRGASASGLPTSAGHGDRAQPSRLAGHAGPRAPWRCQAGSAVPGLVHSRRRVRHSGQPGLLSGGRCAGRAGAGRPLRRGAVRPARSVVRPRGAPGGVRTGRGGRGHRSGPERHGPGPGSRQPVRAGWSARGDPGPAGLLAAVRGGPAVRPERRAPGELPVYGCADGSSAQRPRVRRQANRDHAGAPLPSGLRAVLGRTSRRAGKPGCRRGELPGGARARVLRRCAAYRAAPDEEKRRPGATGPAGTRPGLTGRPRRPGRRLRRPGSPSAPAGR
jgi:hypothetical protein